MTFSRVAPRVWLTLMAGLVAAAFVVSTFFVTQETAQLDALTEDITGNADPSIRHLSSARTELHAMDDLVAASFLDGLGSETLRASSAVHAERLHAAMDAYAALPFFPSERERWERAHTALTHAEDEIAAVIARLEAGDVAGAKRMRASSLSMAVGDADRSLEGLIGFDAGEASRLSEDIRASRHRAERHVVVLDGVVVALAFALTIVGMRATGSYMGAVKRANDLQVALGKKLGTVATGAVSIAESVATQDRRKVLEAAVAAASEVTGAAMAALGVGSDPNVPFEPFVSRGVDAGAMEAKRPPRPIGLLGAVIRDGRTLRLDDAARDARFRGLPAGHPAVGPFLGVPLRHDREVIGHLYLGKPPASPAFTEHDARAVELLATYVATAWQNATTAGELREAIRAREDLLSIVAHDLRNPLSSIIMAASVLTQAASADAAMLGPAQIVARNAARMGRLITDLLTASKLKEGNIAIEPKAAPVTPLLEEAVEQFAFAASEKGIALVVGDAADALVAFCDPARIAQVLANLVGNAVKFTPHDGRVVLSASRSTADESKVIVSVKDTGPGISAETREHLFDRYYSAREHASRGTGLGLFIVKGIVESHGGRVWLESSEGEGSDFQFTLPLADVA